MKEYSEYIDRFDMLEDLPVNEEMIGAYLEGNLSAPEANYVAELIDESPALYELTSADALDAGFSEDDFVQPDFDSFELSELSELPELPGEPYPAQDGRADAKISLGLIDDVDLREVVGVHEIPDYGPVEIDRLPEFSYIDDIDMIDDEVAEFPEVDPMDFPDLADSSETPYSPDSPDIDFIDMIDVF